MASTIEGPTPLRGAAVDSHGDHRLAMTLAVAGLIAEGETTVLRRRVHRRFVPRLCGASLAVAAREPVAMSAPLSLAAPIYRPHRAWWA